ncbi:DUF7312 domain-containing protein [Halogeometricum limi]|uniref:DUF7312 domain-containing protein n=1 Tax=Halogeometricum limi TaxID=555875 RepID=A0A1I6G7R6_9EURY|nr:hypothetical protein [Halogeometricum limi]SFR38235.1 hypothetical protein SAMN04488124_0993 [Halogeometricum limi]
MDRRDDGVDDTEADPTVAPETTPTSADADEEEETDDVFEDPRTLEPLEPGRPTAENALFVVIGAVGTVLLFVTAL